MRVKKNWMRVALRGLEALKFDSQVQAAQKVLIALGYNLGSSGADGLAGSKTQAAIQKFRQDMGLPPGTGVDAQLIAMLPVALARVKSGVAMKPPAETTKPLPGMTPLSISKDTIKSVQKSLISLGYDLGSSGADGVAGSKTQAAIARFRTDMGLPAGTGIDATLLAMLPVALARKATGTYTSSSATSPQAVIATKAKAVSPAAGKSSSPSMITASILPEGFSLTSPMLWGGLAVVGGVAFLLFAGPSSPAKPSGKPAGRKPPKTGKRGRLHGVGAPVEAHVKATARDSERAKRYAAQAISEVVNHNCRAALRALGMAQAATASASTNASAGAAWHKVDMAAANKSLARAEGLFETNCVARRG